MLQVAPTSNPGFLGKLFGCTISAQPLETTELAKLVHTILKASESFSNFMWTWDGFPEEGNSDSQPQPPTPQG